MERFAIRIDERVKERLYKICRLCGVDNREQVVILDGDTSYLTNEDDPSLPKKILDCVGIQVSRGDSMPQKMCVLCVDKINDFFEYREMCKATNLQTRQLLGLPEEPIPKIEKAPFVTIPVGNVKRKRKKEKVEYAESDEDTKPDVDYDPPYRKSLKPGPKCSKVGRPSKSAAAAAETPQLKQNPLSKAQLKQQLKRGPIPKNLRNNKKNVKETTETVTTINVDPIDDEKPYDAGGSNLLVLKKPNKRERQRELLESRKKRNEQGMGGFTIPAGETFPVPLKKPKIEPKIEPTFSCIVCPKDFKAQFDYDVHFFRDHTPHILDHGCSACREAFYDMQESKDHSLWHRMSGIPYECYKCNGKFDRQVAFFRHVNSSCVPKPVFQLVDDIRCEKCKQIFVTQNLYDWHDCFIKNNTHCPKCGRFFVKKLMLYRHLFICNVQKAVPAVVAADITPTPVVVAPAAVAAVKPVQDEQKQLPQSNLKKRGRKPARKHNNQYTVSSSAVVQSDGKKIVKIEPGSILEIENETPLEYNDHNETGFQDDDDGGSEDESNNLTTGVDVPAAKDVAVEPSTETEIPSESTSTTVEPSPSVEVATIAPPEVIQPPPSIRVKQEKIDKRYDRIVERSLQKKSTRPNPMSRINSSASHHQVSAKVVAAHNVVVPPVRIKQEPINNDYGDVDMNVLRNIKPEKMDDGSTPVPNRFPIKPALKLKIKKEHGTLNSTFIDSDAGDDVGSGGNGGCGGDSSTPSTPTPVLDGVEEEGDVGDNVVDPVLQQLQQRRHKKKKTKKSIYKIPKQLAMLIKQEKVDQMETAAAPVDTGNQMARDEVPIHPVERVSGSSAENTVRLPIITQVESIANTDGLPHADDELAAPFFEEEQSNVDDINSTTITTPADTIRLPQITSVTSLSIASVQSLSDVPQIASVMSLSSEAQEADHSLPSSTKDLSDTASTLPGGIRVKMEFNRFMSPPQNAENDTENDNENENRNENEMEYNEGDGDGDENNADLLSGLLDDAEQLVNNIEDHLEDVGVGDVDGQQEALNNLPAEMPACNNETVSDELVKNSVDLETTDQQEVPSNVVIEKPPVTNEVIEKPPITSEVIENPPLTNEVIENPPITSEVIENPPITSEVIENPPLTNEVIGNPSLTNEVIEKSPLANEVIEKPPLTNEVIEKPPLTNEDNVDIPNQHLDSSLNDSITEHGESQDDQNLNIQSEPKEQNISECTTKDESENVSAVPDTKDTIENPPDNINKDVGEIVETGVLNPPDNIDINKDQSLEDPSIICETNKIKESLPNESAIQVTETQEENKVPTEIVHSSINPIVVNDRLDENFENIDSPEEFMFGDDDDDSGGFSKVNEKNESVDETPEIAKHFEMVSDDEFVDENRGGNFKSDGLQKTDEPVTNEEVPANENDKHLPKNVEDQGGDIDSDLEKELLEEQI